jgi:hypothetical protein
MAITFAHSNKRQKLQFSVTFLLKIFLLYFLLLFHLPGNEHQILRFLIPFSENFVCLSYQQFFANFEATRGQNSSKNEKTFFYKYVLEVNFATTPTAWENQVVKICVPYNFFTHFPQIPLAGDF